MILLFIKHLIFYILASTWTLLLCPALVVLFFLPKKYTFYLSKLWTKGLLYLAKILLNIFFEVKGIENLPKDTSYIIASKHQSAWDTMVFSTLLYNPAFFFKQELAWMPILGCYIKKLKMIPVLRKRSYKKELRKKMMDFAKLAIKEKRPLIIFPEGTRGTPGQKLPYKKGVFSFYEEFNLSVIPTALNSGYFWEKRKFIKRPGVIKLVFCPALAQNLSKPIFMKTLTETVEKECEKIIN